MKTYPSNQNLENIVKDVCDEYIRRWKTEGKKYINVSNFELIYAEGTETPIERESTLRVRLPALHKKNPTIPPAIPLLPLDIQRKLPIYLTKTLEIQINWDHYEYWAWSAEVSKAFEDRLPFHEDDFIDLLYLLFHLCLAKLGFTPQTRERAILNKVIYTVVDNHVSHIVTKKFVVGIPIAAAIFETLLRKFIMTYGSTSKEVQKLIQSKELEKRTLGRILKIFEKEVLPYIPQSLRNNIQDINMVVKGVWNSYGNNWREILLNWRNKFMHGARTWAPRAFAVYTNYVCLLLWHIIPDKEYEQKKEELFRTIGWRSHIGVDDYWGFYPPSY